MWYRISNQLQLPETDVTQIPVEPKIQEEEQVQPQLPETQKDPKSLFFDDWARDHYVPVQPVYHGTTHEFDEFKIQNNGQSSLGDGFYFTSSGGEAENYYTGAGGDQQRQIDRIATDIADSYYGNDDELFDIYGEQYPECFEDETVKDIYDLGEKIGRDKVLGGKPKVIPAHIRMKNPYVLAKSPAFPYSETKFVDDFKEDEIPHDSDEEGYEPQENDADYSNNKSFKTLIHKLYDILVLEIGFESDDAYNFVNQVILDNAGYGKDISGTDVFDSITREIVEVDEKFETDYHTELVQKLLESLDFDSIIQDPNHYWPSGDREHNTQHFFLWKPENIKHARENVEFDPGSKKIYSSYMFNPEGQGVLDLGIKLKYNSDNYEARIVKEKNNNNYHNLDIAAYIKGTDIKLGQIDLHFDKTAPEEERFVDVELILIYDPPKAFKDKLKKQYSPDEIDEFSASRVKWGIGEFLYSSARRLIQERMPEAKYIGGNIHSKEAYHARNKAFGEPLEIQDTETKYNMSPLEAQKQIPNMTFDQYSEQPNYQEEESYWVKHSVV